MRLVRTRFLQVALALAILGQADVATAADCRQVSGASVKITGLEKFTVEDASENLSGLACDYRNAGAPICVLVQDEEFEAATAQIDSRGALTVKRTFDLPKIASKKEFDAEAVAFSEGYFYVLGSHSQRAKSCKDNPAGRALARFRLTSVDAEPSEMKVTSTVGNLVASMSALQGYYGQCLGTKPKPDADVQWEPAHGINFEGLAVAGERVLLGLRGPVIGDAAQIIETKIDYLFGTTIGEPKLHSLKLLPKGGVRDLSYHAGQFIILSGSEDDETGGAAIHLWDGQSPGASKSCTIPAASPETRDKPEAVHVLSSDANGVKLLVLSDGPPGGNPRVFVLP